MLMTMTTGKRLEYWKQSVQSMKDSLELEKFVDRCAIIDDQSLVTDLAYMRDAMYRLFPSIKITFLDSHAAGIFRHAQSMRVWSDLVSQESKSALVFHCEDDWTFHKREKNPLAWATALLKEHDWIGQACFASWFHRASGPTTAGGFWIPHAGNSTWYLPTKFTLNPSLIRVASVQRVADGFRDEDNFEGGYGSRWMMGGYETVHSTINFCEHIGQKSAYEINGSAR